MAKLRPCSIDCLHDRWGDSSYHRLHVEQQEDITGIGALIAYTATAGCAIVVIAVYYLVGHRPDLDPFRDGEGKSEDTSQFKPNPVDELFLGFIRRPFRSWKRFMFKEHFQLENALLKCVLRMSDVQILTGISILVSGYLQLKCGLASEQWQILIYLAWFSSVTNLSCLTILRNFLYTHPGDRFWRLVAMGSLLVMLVVALLPTATSYNSIYAICLFEDLKNGNFRRKIYSITMGPVIVSILMLCLGFLSRVIRLHRGLYNGIFARSRKFLSKHCRSGLRIVDTRRFGILGRLLFYRPALSIFLCGRVLMDVGASYFLEVLWLIINFYWGMAHLIISRGWVSHHYGDASDNVWTFGQVVQVVLVLSPLLTVIQTVSEQPSNLLSDRACHGSETSLRQATCRRDSPNLPLNTNDEPHDHREHDFIHDSWFQSFMFYTLCAIIWMIVSNFCLPSTPANPLTVESPFNFLTTPFEPAFLLEWFVSRLFFAMSSFVLFNLVLADLGWGRKPLNVLLWVASFFYFFIAPYIWGFDGGEFDWTISRYLNPYSDIGYIGGYHYSIVYAWGIPVLLAVYVGLCFLVCFRQRKAAFC